MKVKVNILCLLYEDVLLDYRVLGSDDDFDRVIAFNYPRYLETPPSEENNWCGGEIVLFTDDDLQETFQKYCGTYEVERMINQVKRYGKLEIERKACYMPSLGLINIVPKSYELEI